MMVMRGVMITLKRFAFKPDIWAQRQRRGVSPLLLGDVGC